jgi:hypothetical protein
MKILHHFLPSRLNRFVTIVGTLVFLFGLRVNAVTDNTKLISTASKIGNPAAAQFPNDSKEDAFARSVWDLQLHDGKIYAGTGDWTRNRGPIRVYSFIPSQPNSITFTTDYTINGESIDIFRVAGRDLLIPDIDPRESWDAGNLYFKRQGKWIKQRTIPEAVHVLDAAYFQNKWYVATSVRKGKTTVGALFESADSGRSWRSVPGGYNRSFRLNALAPTPEGLILFDITPEKGVYLYDGSKTRKIKIDAIPGGAVKHRIHHATSFKGGVLYTQEYAYDEYKNDRPDDALNYSAPLFWLANSSSQVRTVGTFGEQKVSDILVRGDRCYILSFKVQDDGFLGEIFSSSDLESWQREAAVIFPAIPRSLERADDGAFYVGLGASFSSDSKTRAQSGSIWKLSQP